MQNLSSESKTCKKNIANLIKKLQGNAKLRKYSRSGFIQVSYFEIYFASYFAIIPIFQEQN